MGIAIFILSLVAMLLGAGFAMVIRRYGSFFRMLY